VPCFQFHESHGQRPGNRAGPTQGRVGLERRGARGFAHIGVIEWLEEHRIPVDIVTGTSMGGLIAGMYATGMTPAEAHQFITAVDWDKSLLAEPNYDQLSFRRKEDRRALPARRRFGVEERAERAHWFQSRPWRGAAV